VPGSHQPAMTMLAAAQVFEVRRWRRGHGVGDLGVAGPKTDPAI